MKLYSAIISAAAALLLLPGCNGSTASSDNQPTGKQAEADSLMNYFGEMNAQQFLSISERDTLYQTSDAQEQFILGLKAGVSAVTDRQIYNEGLYRGIDMALAINEFNKHYNVHVSPDVVVKSFTEALKKGKISDEEMRDLQVDYSRLLRLLEESVNPTQPQAPVASPAAAENAAADTLAKEAPQTVDNPQPAK